MHIYLGFVYILLRKNSMLTFGRNRLKRLSLRPHTHKKQYLEVTFLVPVRSLSRPSGSMYFGDVSLRPRDPKWIGRAEILRPRSEASKPLRKVTMADKISWQPTRLFITFSRHYLLAKGKKKAFPPSVPLKNVVQLFKLHVRNFIKQPDFEWEVGGIQIVMFFEIYKP